MSRKKLETIVLIIGSAVFITGLILLLTRGSNPNNAFIGNLVFAAGFLIYVIYNVLNTSSLQKEIKALQEQVAALNTSLDAAKSELDKTKKELNTKTSELDKSKEENKTLEKKVAALEENEKRLNDQLEKKLKGTSEET